MSTSNPLAVSLLSLPQKPTSRCQRKSGSTGTLAGRCQSDDSSSEDLKRKTHSIALIMISASLVPLNCWGPLLCCEVLPQLAALTTLCCCYHSLRLIIRCDGFHSLRTTLFSLQLATRLLAPIPPLFDAMPRGYSSPRSCFHRSVCSDGFSATCPDHAAAALCCDRSAQTRTATQGTTSTSYVVQ